MTYYSELASYFIRIAVNLILIGTPISIGILIGLKLTRAAPPRIRYLLTVTAFFAAAIVPFVLTVASTPETPPPQTSVSAEIQGRTLTTDVHTPAVDLPRDSESNATGNVLDSVVGFLSQTSFSIGAFTLWLAGACLLLSREIASHLLVASARQQWTPATSSIRERLSWPKNIPLFVENELGPCALGVFHPIVIIPARLLEELPPSSVRQIAQHELDHLKWRDPSVHAAMRIVCALLWVSAPLWYLYRAARLEREAASDRAAVNSTLSRLQPDIVAVEYAATLVSVAKSCARMGRRRKRAWITTEIGNESGLNDRVRRLMEISSRLTSARLSLALGILLICSGSVILLPLAKLKSDSNENLDQQTLQEQTASSSTASFDVGPSKKANTRTRLASVNVRARPEVQRGRQDSSLVKPTRDAIVEDAVSASPLATSTSSDLSTTIQAVQPGDLESQMAAVGYKNLTADQLAKMRAYAVGPAYVKEMADSGYSGLSADMLIRFKWFAVSRSFIKEMETLGYENLPPRTLVDFRQHGVNADYIRQIRTRISGPISGEQLASLRLHGTSIEFVDKLKALGYEKLTAEQLISMRLQGVSIAFIESLRAQGHKSLSADDLIGMRMRGGN